MIFFFNDTATTEIYTLSLHDALPICPLGCLSLSSLEREGICSDSWCRTDLQCTEGRTCRSEEHTSELQSRQYLVCRLLLEKKKYYNTTFTTVLTSCIIVNTSQSRYTS